MSTRDTDRFETKAIHAGQQPDPSTGAVMTPVYLTSTYAQSGPGEHKGFEYSRTRNPTRDALQGCLAALESGKHGLAFASGLAATDAVLHLLSSGDHVVLSDDLYGGTFRLADKVFKRLGITENEARDRFGFFLDALEYGTPPHGGIALGLDRIVAILCGESSIREVIAFPKTANAVDLMAGAPSPVDPEQLEELHLKIRP